MDPAPPRRSLAGGVSQKLNSETGTSAKRFFMSNRSVCSSEASPPASLPLCVGGDFIYFFRSSESQLGSASKSSSLSLSLLSPLPPSFFFYSSCNFSTLTLSTFRLRCVLSLSSEGRPQAAEVPAACGEGGAGAGGRPAAGTLLVLKRLSDYGPDPTCLPI